MIDIDPGSFVLGMAFALGCLILLGWADSKWGG